MSSDGIRVEICIFACGHGDTILVRLPGDRWVLVDCYLPKRGGVRDRFFDFVEERGIRSLDYIFQTHPDVDHFHGMDEILRFFSQKGRTVGWWCDGGINARHVEELTWGDALDKRRYERLQRCLDKLDADGAIGFHDVGEGYEPICPKDYKGRIEFLAVAPNAGVKRRTARVDLGRLAADPTAGMQANALSVVLVLSLREAGHSCSVFLAADAGGDSLDLALDAWEERADELEHSRKFDVVKVPHHGSIRSHSERTPSIRRDDRNLSVAAISAGTRKVLPDRIVIQEYIDHGWTVMVTTTRRGARPRNRLIDVADRSPRSDVGVAQHNIEISVIPEGVVSQGPDSAVVRPSHVANYEAAPR